MQILTVKEYGTKSSPIILVKLTSKNKGGTFQHDSVSDKGDNFSAAVSFWQYTQVMKHIF